MEIAFEAGATHSSVDEAIELTELAASAGADAIKFQIILDPDSLFAPGHNPTITYFDTIEGLEVTKLQLEVIKPRCLKKKEWEEVRKCARECGISFYATGVSDNDIYFMADIGVDAIKVAAADVNHFPLLNDIAATGLPVLIDTGRHTLGEVEKAVHFLQEHTDVWRITVVHCPSGYPARVDGINLNVIRTLHLMFPDLDIGFSDHSPGWEMDVAATALGVDYIEKTITLNRDQPGPEHCMSLEPIEMDNFVQLIREVDRALGSTTRILSPAEKEARKAIRRGKYGDKWQRPENDMRPDLWWDLPAGYTL